MLKFKGKEQNSCCRKVFLLSYTPAWPKCYNEKRKMIACGLMEMDLVPTTDVQVLSEVLSDNLYYHFIYLFLRSLQCFDVPLQAVLIWPVKWPAMWNNLSF